MPFDFYQTTPKEISLTISGLGKCLDTMLTPGRRRLIIYLLRQWVKQTDRGETFIHPGAEAMEKASGLSERPCRTARRRLESIGFLIPVGREKGGSGCATEYQVNASTLLAWMDAQNARLTKGFRKRFLCFVEMYKIEADCPVIEGGNEGRLSSEKGAVTAPRVYNKNPINIPLDAIAPLEAQAEYPDDLSAHCLEYDGPCGNVVPFLKVSTDFNQIADEWPPTPPIDAYDEGDLARPPRHRAEMRARGHERIETNGKLHKPYAGGKV